MLGWEFPPFISGGLGTACYGLTKAMSRRGLRVTFVLPKPVKCTDYSTHVRMQSPADIPPDTAGRDEYRLQLKNVRFKTIDSPLRPYASPQAYQQEIDELIRTKKLSSGSKEPVAVGNDGSHYGGDMYAEVQRYAAAAVQLALGQDCLLYTSPSPRDGLLSRMPSSA